MGEEEERKERIALLSRRAREVLQNPLVVGFLEDERQQALRAFEALPIDAKLEEYRTVHHFLLAMIKFEQRLKEYVTRHELEVLTEPEEEGDTSNLEI